MLSPGITRLLLVATCGVLFGAGVVLAGDAWPQGRVVDLPCDSVSIILEVRGGWGDGSVWQLRADGAGTVTNRDRAGEASERPLAFRPADFSEVLNRFYRAKFFQLAESYEASSDSVYCGRDGKLKHLSWSFYDFPTMVLKVRLGDWQTSVRFSQHRGAAPVYLTELTRAVTDLAHGVAIK